MWLSFNCRLTAYSLYAAVSVGLQVRIMISSYNYDKVIYYIIFIIRQFGFVYALLS